MKDRIETIAAVATPPGVGGVGIVRVSGPRVRALALAILGAVPAPREAKRSAFAGSDGEAIDDGIALFFPAPASYTGEDVLEMHGHGGPVVMDRLLARTISLGARIAMPGEFTRRAFLNDKLDLAQAEAVADLIASASVNGARAARRSLEGALSRRVETLVESLVALRVHVEAAIDFPEDEVDELADERIAKQLDAIDAALARTRDEAHRGRLLTEGITVAIAGRPNVGKSSLLNRLAREDAAIVTDVPGTTRDVIHRRVHLDGLPLHVVDTAGLRDTSDPIEHEGIERAWRAIAAADAILLVVEDAAGVTSDDASILGRLPEGPVRIHVRNKIDLSGSPPGVAGDGDDVRVCALTGEGVDALESMLKTLVGYRETEGDGAFTARRRHLEALAVAGEALTDARARLVSDRAGELAAEELRRAQVALGEITGEFGSEDLLGRIFATFCIGK